MRASANIKQIAEGVSGREFCSQGLLILFLQKTPTRSILKSGSCFTAERKTVLFQDESDIGNDIVELGKGLAF